MTIKQILLNKGYNAALKIGHSKAKVDAAYKELNQDMKKANGDVEISYWRQQLATIGDFISGKLSFITKISKL